MLSVGMSYFRDSAPEKSAPGRGIRSILASIAGLFTAFATALKGNAIGAGSSGHLGPQRALRLSTLLAPRNRKKLGAGVLIVVGAVVASLALRRPAIVSLDNAIWLDRTWTFGDIDSGRMRELTDRLIANQIGTAYVYASSLGIDRRWAGGPRGQGSFMESRQVVADFVRSFKSQHDKLRAFGWIEIWTHLDSVDGYRLDDTSLHSNIADFSRLLTTQLGFDGVLLDVKPMFSDNNDLIRLIQRVRRAVGYEVPIAVAATADLTPQALRQQNIESIAPGTMWSPNFKKRVMLAADEVILLMYQSYRQAPLDYVNWVAYHVEAYINELDTSTRIIVSIPNYGGASSAHNPAIETLKNALDGVTEGLRRLDEGEGSMLSGIAIFSDGMLSQSDWNVFREMWLQR